MSNRRLFYINYGAGARLTSTIVEADDWLSAKIYAYQEAKDDFYDNVGTGDLLSLEQFLERNHCEDGDENAIYELEIQSNSTARYRLITDRDIQRSLVSTFTPYVTNGCEYEGNPMIINEIIHLDYGTLHLCDGIWCIENKARVMIRS